MEHQTNRGLTLSSRDFRVEPGEAIDLATRPTSWTTGAERSRREIRSRAKSELARHRVELADAQEKLFAAGRHAVLLVLQGLDASGKDSTIKHVARGMNPAGVQVSSFRQPTGEELGHHFLWRYTRLLPRLGYIGIFNRSYYEEVMAGRVHPQVAGVEGRRAEEAGYWRERCEDINALERHLTREGTLLIKCFLHVSREAQRRRLLKRLKKPDKHWKFSDADLIERRFWEAHIDAAQAALTDTSTPWAPWHVIPADDKRVMRAAVARIMVERLASLDLRFPDPDPAKREAMSQALKALSG